MGLKEGAQYSMNGDVGGGGGERRFSVFCSEGYGRVSLIEGSRSEWAMRTTKCLYRYHK